ncbi:uncharacterized protein LOC117290586 [Asterias rubens]|uniref:uncharacterized protein LOC117290586 n=1 Tax=Asterias rubens TaxID=7604 RepID=UPI0014551C93|nr:uncharacterized protein LOC117290586 [Asterias rubens]
MPRELKGCPSQPRRRGNLIGLQGASRFKPSRFSFAPSRKRLNYDDNSKQPRQTILLESNTDSDDDETKKVLEMSKKESERKKREADERLRLEEEELKKESLRR